MQPDRPIITLTSDFGEADYYVAAMKAVLLSYCPVATLVDVTHRVPPQDIHAGAILVERAVASFAAGTVHLAVIDPGVGTCRRILIVQIHQQQIVCPDNGLVTWAARRQSGYVAFNELTWRPTQPTSNVFHGRDLMAPVAGMLAAGRPVAELARAIDDPIMLDLWPATGPSGQIIYIDRFGNAITNIPAEIARRAPATAIHAGPHAVGPLMQFYGQVRPGQALALINSSDLLEIAVRDGSAAQQLCLRVGDEVRFA